MLFTQYFRRFKILGVKFDESLKGGSRALASYIQSPRATHGVYLLRGMQHWFVAAIGVSQSFICDLHSVYPLHPGAIEQHKWILTAGVHIAGHKSKRSVEEVFANFSVYPNLDISTPPAKRRKS